MTHIDGAYLKAKYLPSNPNDKNLDVDLNSNSILGKKNYKNIHQGIIAQSEKTQACAIGAGVFTTLCAVGGIAVSIAAFAHPSSFGILTQGPHQWGACTLAAGSLIFGAITIRLSSLKNRNAVKLRDNEMRALVKTMNTQTSIAGLNLNK